MFMLAADELGGIVGTETDEIEAEFLMIPHRIVRLYKASAIALVYPIRSIMSVKTLQRRLARHDSHYKWSIHILIGLLHVRGRHCRSGDVLTI